MIQRISTWFMVGSFLALMGLPAVLALFGIYQHNSFFPQPKEKPTLEFSLNENSVFSLGFVRSLYVSVIDYKYEYDRFFNDYYVLKYELFDIYVYLVQNLLHTEPMPHKVIEGNNDMMFCGNWHNNYVKDSKGFAACEPGTVSMIAKEISRQSAWCTEHGIAYYFAVAPNKLSVHGENLSIENYGLTPLRELISDALHPSVNFIDFTPVLASKKDKFKLYRNDDTHWNPIAAYFAYSELMAEIQIRFPEVLPISREEYELDSIVGLQNDLVRQIRKETNETQYVLRKINTSTATLVKRVYRPEVQGVIGDYEHDYEKRYSNNPRPLKILVLRDSFGCAMVEFIRESFGTSVLIWDNSFDTTMILNEQPDIVLNMVVERHLEGKFAE